MSSRKSLLTSIAYIPSYKPKNPKPKPKLLESDEAWNKLVADVSEYIEGCKAKKKGKGEVKPFHIEVVDMSGGDSAKSTGSKKVSHCSCEAASSETVLLKEKG